MGSLGRASVLRLVGLSVLAWGAAATAAEPAITRLNLPDYEYAEWLADGSGFYVIGNDTLQRFDANGRARGPKRPLPGLPPDAIAGGFRSMSHRGLSADGKRLVLFPSVEGAPPQPYVIDLANGRAQKLDLGQYVGALEWMADGTLIGWKQPDRRFFVDAAGRVTSWCPQYPYLGVHAHPDGQRLLVGGEKLYIVDRACHTTDTFAPWSAVGAAPTWVFDAAFSPSGARLALAGGTADERTLWVMAADHAGKPLRTSVQPNEPLAWLGEDRIVVSLENGGTGTAQRLLATVDAATGAVKPIVPTQPTCTDSEPSASRRGDRILFRRLCDDPKGSFVALVRAR